MDKLEEISKDEDARDESEHLNTEKEGSEENSEVRSEIEGINDENMKDTEDGNDNEDMKDDGEENQKTESISESLSEIFVNSEKTLDQIEDVKKQVRFNLEPEDMDMTMIESNFATDIPVGDIVNQLFKVQDSDKKEEEKIDDDYVNFPSSQANADSFFDEMRQKEENKYVVETEDITDDESEDKSMDLKPVEENNTTENNDVEDSKESEKVKDKNRSFRRK